MKELEQLKVGNYFQAEKKGNTEIYRVNSINLRKKSIIYMDKKIEIYKSKIISLENINKNSDYIFFLNSISQEIGKESFLSSIEKLKKQHKKNIETYFKNEHRKKTLEPTVKNSRKQLIYLDKWKEKIQERINN